MGYQNFLNNMMKQMRGDGRYQAIYDKWFASDAWLKDIQ
jgi:polar amino acid transport system substrate-binding protein